MLDSVLQDLRLAFRQLRRSPGFSIVAIITLALGIGATTAIFSVLERVVLDPLPYPQAGRLVRLENLVPGSGTDAAWQLSTAQYVYYRANVRAFDALGLYQTGGANVEAPRGARRAVRARVTPEVMRLLGARAALGRVLTAPDGASGAPPVAVLSHAYWVRQFGGNPSVVGRTLTIDGGPVRVVGVMAAGIDLPPDRGHWASPPVDLWTPFPIDPAGPFQNHHVFPAIARLAPGATLAQAQAQLDRLTPRLSRAFPNVYTSGFIRRYGFRPVVYSLKSYVLGDVGRNLWILLGAVGLVLLIATANVGNLFLARVEVRRRELALRTALGAGRLRLAGQFFAECLVLALPAGLLAMGLAAAGIGALVAAAPAGLPRLGDIRIDPVGLAVALGLAILAATTLAFISLLRGREVAGVAALAGGERGATAGRARQRTRSALIVGQVGLALVLLVGAGLLVQSFQRLRSVDPGVSPRGVLTASIHLPYTTYPNASDGWRMLSAALERIRALPGVVAAGAGEEVPLTGGYGCTVQGFEDSRVYDRARAAGVTTCAGQMSVGPGYFEALGIPVLEGRGSLPSDDENPRTGAVIVSRAFADRFWPGEDPIGKGVVSGSARGPWYHVVGVVGDVRASSLEEPPPVAIYYPIVSIPKARPFYPEAMRLVVKTRLTDPMSLLPAIRGVVAGVDPTVPVSDAETMSTLVANSMSRLTFILVLLGSAAGMAILLAAVGLYGVVGYLVARRTGEIGVRMALGARPAAVRRLVVGGSLRLVGVGLVLGVAAALVLTRVLGGLLYGVGATSPVAYVGAALCLAAVALVASWLPARRAARVDPMRALREE